MTGDPRAGLWVEGRAHWKHTLAGSVLRKSATAGREFPRNRSSTALLIDGCRRSYSYVLCMPIHGLSVPGREDDL